MLIFSFSIVDRLVRYMDSPVANGESDACILAQEMTPLLFEYLCHHEIPRSQWSEFVQRLIRCGIQTSEIWASFQQGPKSPGDDIDVSGGKRQRRRIGSFRSWFPKASHSWRDLRRSIFRSTDSGSVYPEWWFELEPSDSDDAVPNPSKYMMTSPDRASDEKTSRKSTSHGLHRNLSNKPSHSLSAPSSLSSVSNHVWTYPFAQKKAVERRQDSSDSSLPLYKRIALRTHPHSTHLSESKPDLELGSLSSLCLSDDERVCTISPDLPTHVLKRKYRTPWLLDFGHLDTIPDLTHLRQRSRHRLSRRGVVLDDPKCVHEQRPLSTLFRSEEKPVASSYFDSIALTEKAGPWLSKGTAFESVQPSPLLTDHFFRNSHSLDDRSKVIDSKESGFAPDEESCEEQGSHTSFSVSSEDLFRYYPTTRHLRRVFSAVRK